MSTPTNIADWAREQARQGFEEWVAQIEAGRAAGIICQGCDQPPIGRGYHLCAECFEREARRAQRQGGFDHPDAFDPYAPGE